MTKIRPYPSMELNELLDALAGNVWCAQQWCDSDHIIRIIHIAKVLESRMKQHLADIEIEEFRERCAEHDRQRFVIGKEVIS